MRNNRAESPTDSRLGFNGVINSRIVERGGNTDRTSTVIRSVYRNGFARC